MAAAYALAALLGFPAPRALAGEPASETPPTVAADRDGLRQAMLENQIDTARPRPGAGLYAHDAGIAFSQRLAGWLSGLLPRLGWLKGPALEGILRWMLAAVAVALLGLSIRFALLWWRRRRPQGPAAPVRELGAAEPAPAGSATRWEDELRRRLDGRDAAAALEALWWWLASRLAGDRAEPSWTARELIARTGRRDLAPGIRRLERMIYGAGRPFVEDVDRLWRELREATG